MKLKFIGTGSGKTSLKRFHSSFVIFSGEERILFDAGDSVSRALLNAEIEFNRIDSIILSHYHADHFAGIGSLITQMKLSNRNSKLTVYTHSFLSDALINFLRTVYLFPKTLGFELSIEKFETDERFRINDSLSFIPKRNGHIKNKNESEITQVSFISHSFLFSENGRNVFVSSDIASAEDLYLFSNERIDSAILETTHVAVSDLFKFAESFKISTVYLTHIDDEDEADIISAIGKNSRSNASFILAMERKLAEL